MSNKTVSSSSSSSSGGVGFFGLLTIVFIVLKLTKVISWSWWWVFSPMLFGVGIFALVLIFAAVFLLVRK